MNRFIEEVLRRGRDLYIIRRRVEHPRRGDVSEDVYLLNLLSYTEEELPTLDSPYREVKSFFSGYFNVTYLNQKMPTEQKIHLYDMETYQLVSLGEMIDEVFGENRSNSLNSFIATQLDHRRVLMSLLEVGLGEHKNTLSAYYQSIIEYLKEIKEIRYPDSVSK